MLVYEVWITVRELPCGQWLAQRHDKAAKGGSSCARTFHRPHLTVLPLKCCCCYAKYALREGIQKAMRSRYLQTDEPSHNGDTIYDSGYCLL
jgi:hypothetical protein